MRKVLVLNASITGNTLSATKIVESKRTNESWNYVDLNEELDGQLLTSKSISGFYSDSEKYISQLLEHDEVFIATPMINFNSSPALEAWFAKVIIPGRTFAYKGNAYDAPLGEKFKNKKVTILMTSGSTLNFYTESIKQVSSIIADRLRIIGFENISIKWISGTNMSQNSGKSIEKIAQENNIDL